MPPRRRFERCPVLLLQIQSVTQRAIAHVRDGQCLLYIFARAMRGSVFNTLPRQTLAAAPPRAADTVYILHYRHRYPVHGTGYRLSIL